MAGANRCRSSSSRPAPRTCLSPPRRSRSCPKRRRILPGFDNVMDRPDVEDAGGWPSLAGKKSVLEKANHPGLPVVREHFVEGNTEYLIEEVPQGRSLWDAWDEPESTADVRLRLAAASGRGPAGPQQGGGHREWLAQARGCRAAGGLTTPPG